MFVKSKYKFNGTIKKIPYKHLSEFNFSLKEEDFYPPDDNRIWKSYIEDIDGGDNFEDYCEYIFKILKKENYYEE